MLGDGLVSDEERHAEETFLFWVVEVVTWREISGQEVLECSFSGSVVLYWFSVHYLWAAEGDNCWCWEQLVCRITMVGMDINFNLPTCCYLWERTLWVEEKWWATKFSYFPNLDRLYIVVVDRMWGWGWRTRVGKLFLIRNTKTKSGHLLHKLLWQWWVEDQQKEEEQQQKLGMEGK